MTKEAVVRRFALALVLAFVLAAVSAPGAAASGWSLQHVRNPRGGTNIDLNGVACPSKRVCAAVGLYDNGTTHLALAERWTGR